MSVRPRTSLGRAAIAVFALVTAWSLGARGQHPEHGRDGAGGSESSSNPDAGVVAARDGGAAREPVPDGETRREPSALHAVDDAGETATPADERSATSALGADDDDLPDPVAEEGERSGSAEGEPVGPRAGAANEIAALSDRGCYRALQRARVPFERVHRVVAGVGAPVHVTGPIGGVRYLANDRREVHELMDCRLAVALVRFSRLLRALDFVEVRHYSTYRVPDARAVSRRPLQARHGGGLAIDAATFIRANGSRLNVERDFHGRMGRPVCGPEARVPSDPGARVLRSIACDAARRGLFHVILTPNFNRPHRNHFHLEVTRGVDWRFVH